MRADVRTCVFFRGAETLFETAIGTSFREMDEFRCFQRSAGSRRCASRTQLSITIKPMAHPRVALKGGPNNSGIYLRGAIRFIRAKHSADIRDTRQEDCVTIKRRLDSAISIFEACSAWAALKLTRWTVLIIEPR